MYNLGTLVRVEYGIKYGLDARQEGCSIRHCEEALDFYPLGQITQLLVIY